MREKLLLSLSLVVFVALASLRAYAQPFPFYDDVAFLRLGNDVRLLGGPLALIPKLFEGSFTEANRHPIYFMLLALLSGADEGYHRRAQVLTVALGALALLTAWWVARRRFGATPALILAGFLAVSNTLLDASSHETCEPLLVVFFALAIGAILDGRDRPRAYLAAGVFSGLAYLTKGTGIFLPICFAIAFALDRAQWQKKQLAGAIGFFAAFAITASPLLIRNLRVYGSPTYTINSRWLWIDRLSDFAEIFAPRADELFPRGPIAYLEQATAGSIAERAGMGVAETFFHLGDSLGLASPKAGGVVHVFFVVIGILAALAAIRILWKSAPSWKRTVLLVITGWVYAFFVFYNAVAGSARYLFPATLWLVAILAEHLPERAIWRRIPIALGAISLCAIAVFGFDVASLQPGFAETEAWLIEHVHPGEVYAIDARTKLQPEWRLPGVEQLIVSTSFRDRPVPERELLDYLRAKHVRYVVLDASSLEHLGDAKDDDARRYFFYDRLHLEPGGSLPLSGWPPELTVAWADPSTPRRWMILELKP